MISQITGQLIEKRPQSLIVNVGGLYYEVMVPASVQQRVEETKDSDANIHLVTYHYFQLTPSAGMPILIGFINEVERDFFQQFIKVSGIGPRAAVKALNQPISDITDAIEKGDVKFLKTLPGIGLQRAKEIVAKLQGKIGKFGLIKDHATVSQRPEPKPDWHKEALDVLIQLQYKKNEAEGMIDKALERGKDIDSAEKLLNEIYKQKVKV